MPIAGEDIGFVVLCAEARPQGAAHTAEVARRAVSGCDVRVVLPGTATNGEAREMSRVAPTLVAGRTLTAMVNGGLRYAVRPWNFVVFGGATVTRDAARKFRCFARDDMDVLFPVVGRRWLFDEGSMNGLFVSGAAYEAAGPFPEEEESLARAKLLWAGMAAEAGCCFKAVVGAQFV